MKRTNTLVFLTALTGLTGCSYSGNSGMDWNNFRYSSSYHEGTSEGSSESHNSRSGLSGISMIR